MVNSLANQLSTITTHEADMESEPSKTTDTTRLEHEVAPNPFATANYQFNSGSMMTSPHSIPAGAHLERLLLQPSPQSSENSNAITTQSPSERGQENALHLGSVKVSADSTTIQTLSDPNQNQIPGLALGQNQTSEWNAVEQNEGVVSPGVTTQGSGSSAMMEEASPEMNPT